MLGSGCFCSGKAAAKTIYNQESELFSKVSVEIKKGKGAETPSPFCVAEKCLGKNYLMVKYFSGTSTEVEPM